MNDLHRPNVCGAVYRAATARLLPSQRCRSRRTPICDSWQGVATPPGSSSAPGDVPNALRAAAPCLQGGCGASKHGAQRGRPSPPPPAGGTPSPNSRRGGIAVIDASDCRHRAVNVPARVGGYHALHGERLPSGVLRGRRPSSQERLPTGVQYALQGQWLPNGIPTSVAIAPRRPEPCSRRDLAHDRGASRGGAGMAGQGSPQRQPPDRLAVALRPGR